MLLRIDRKGKIEEVSLKDVKFAKATLPDPFEPRSSTCWQEEFP